MGGHDVVKVEKAGTVQLATVLHEKSCLEKGIGYNVGKIAVR